MINRTFIYKYLVPEFIKEIRRKRRIHIYPIIKDVTKVFHVLCKVKDGMWDEMIYPSLYGRTKEQYMKVYTEPQYAVEIPLAMITCNSDVIISPKGVCWDKYNEEEFTTWAKPADINVINYNRDTITILHNKRQEYIAGMVLSVMGLWSYHWEHFLVQYVCKMYYAGENGLLNTDLTIIYHDRGDACIVQFIQDYISHFPHVSIKKAEEGVDYLCEMLISIPTTASNPSGKFRLDYTGVLSASVVDRINKYVVKPYVEKVKNNTQHFNKIFLQRKGMRRTLVNYDEIHDFFAELGFVDIEGANLTLEQKADIFYHAEEVVGLVGGAETNLIFCNGARCMLFNGYHTVTQSWGYTLTRGKLKSLVFVAGIDESSDYHSNYTIPFEKVKKAYYDCVCSKNTSENEND